MKIIDIAIVMLVFNGCLLVVNEVQPFGVAPFSTAAQEITSAEMTGAQPTTPDSDQSTTEAFLQEGTSAIFKETTGVFGRLRNTFFMGSVINNIMAISIGIDLPTSLITLFDAITGFIYALATIQIFLRFKAE